MRTAYASEETVRQLRSPCEVPQSVDRFRWSQAVCSEQGPAGSITRLVLLVISLHMDADGTRAWPSQQTIASRARISRRSVVTHLESAEREGWVSRYVAGRNSQGWRLSGYKATVPDRVYPTLPDKPWDADPNWKRGERSDPPIPQRGEPSAQAQVEEPRRGVSGIGDVVKGLAVRCATGEKRGEPGAHKSSLLNLPSESSLRGNVRLRAREFETFCEKEKPGEDQEADRRRSTTIADLLSKGYGAAEIPRLMHTSHVTLDEVLRVEAVLRSAAR
jgi:DNA-binding Lrp family transcriptional regulator